jgi:hypothetical protein
VTGSQLALGDDVTHASQSGRKGREIHNL